MLNEELKREIESEIDKYLSNKKFPTEALMELCVDDFQAGAEVYAEKYQAEVEAHKRTKVEFELLRKAAKYYLNEK